LGYKTDNPFADEDDVSDDSSAQNDSQSDDDRMKDVESDESEYDVGDSDDDQYRDNKRSTKENVFNPHGYDDDLNKFGDFNDLLFMITPGKQTVTKIPQQLSQLSKMKAVVHNGLTIRPGTTVKLSENNNGDYLRVVNILNDGFSNTTLQGLRLRHNRHMNGYIPNTYGDLTIIVNVSCEDGEPVSEQALVEIPIEEVEGFQRVKLVAGTGINTDPLSLPKDTLLCQTICFTEIEGCKQDRVRSVTIRTLKQEEADEPLESIQDTRSIPQVRRETGQGNIARRYTIGDICHGAGGATEAAKLANFKAGWAVDHNVLCGKTYRMNNPKARIFTQDLHEFALKCKFLAADLLHISVPCCPWSTANAKGGQNDAANKKLLYLIPDLIAKVRPRQVVIEQVSGLIRKTIHRAALAKLIRGILAKEYNVSYMVINFQHYGSCARRERLKILASAYVTI
jgi:hypothetical protein